MREINVILKGGLGNQMFQYAFAKSLATKYQFELVLDSISGFKRDKVYKRKYALDQLNLPDNIRISSTINLRYLYELFLEKIGLAVSNVITKRMYGQYIKELEPLFVKDLERLINGKQNILVDGYWQNEAYFKGIEKSIYEDYNISDSRFPALAKLAEKLKADNAVAIGIRLFEDMPGEDKSGVGGLTELDFYRKGASILASPTGDTKYFIFSTSSNLLKKNFSLNGEIEYITIDEGYADEAAVLWLLSQCKKQVIANSSFFWWGAWLAEKKNAEVKIIASKLFPSVETVPLRWRTEWENIYKN